jgi:hypothetical protein
MRLLVLLLFACGDDAATVDAGGGSDAGTDAGFEGRTFYLATTGSDGGDGSESAPFLTFERALGELEAGDTLVVRDGVYPAPERIAYDCESARCDGAPCASGSPGAPITIRAENERRAELAQTDVPAISVSGCSHIAFEGFWVHQADVTTTNGSNPIVSIDRSEHIELRKLLVSSPNRYMNSHAIRISDAQHALVEDCEVYDYHRSGIALYRTEHAVIRRNYVNSRETPNLMDGYMCCDLLQGDYGIWVGGSYAALVENNVVEHNSRAFLVTAAVDGVEDFGPNASKGHRFIGNVAIAGERGIDVTSNCDSVVPCPPARISSDIEIVHMAAIGFVESFYANAIPRLVYRNVTSIDASNRDFLIRETDTNASLEGSFAAVNALDFGSGTGSGWEIVDQGSATVASTNSFGNETDVVAGAESFVSPPGTLDPALGGCAIAIPPGSPMRGAGSRGADIGASILFRTIDGVETTEPLWDPATGAFACGAIVPGGPNDPAMHAETCSNVHERVGVAACR